MDITSELQEKGLSAKTVKLAITVVRNAMSYDVEHYGMSDIMLNTLLLPKQKVMERIPLTSEKQSKFVDYALSHNVRVYLCMLLVLSFAYGNQSGRSLRLLRCYNVDFRHNRIYIHQTIYHISRPKSENHEHAIVTQECEELREIRVSSVFMSELKKLHNRNAKYYVFTGKETPLEMHRIGYDFPMERIACYGADLLVRQYDQIKQKQKEQGKDFSYCYIMRRWSFSWIRMSIMIRELFSEIRSRSRESTFCTETKGCQYGIFFFEGEEKHGLESLIQPELVWISRQPDIHSPV